MLTKRRQLINLNTQKCLNVPIAQAQNASNARFIYENIADSFNASATEKRNFLNLQSASI